MRGTPSAAIFEELDIRPYFGTITKEEVVSCIMGDDRI